MSAGRRREGRLPRRLGLVLLGAAVGLVLAELAARLLLPPPRTHDQPNELHAELGFRGVPGTRIPFQDERGSYEFALGRQGFRGRELPAGPGAARRVLFLGDSFLVGLGLRAEELVTARSERALRERGVTAEVYNLSTIDTGTGQQLLLLERFGPGLAPDDVVLVLYPANDVVNDTIELAGRTRVSPADAVRPYVLPDGEGLAREYVHPLRGPLRTHSRLFALAERSLFSWSVSGVGPAPSMTARLRNGRPPREELEIFRRHDPGDAWEQGWRRSFSLLRAVRDRCQQLGARLLVLVVPSEHQVQRGAKVVGWDLATRLVLSKPLDALLDWNLPEQRLARFFGQQGIEARLLLGPLREAVAAGQRVYARDGHLSEAGHALAARPVVDWLHGSQAARAPRPPAGEPVRVLPSPGDAPARLDFRRARHEAFLGDGWLDWQAETGQGGGGWHVVARALVVLPERTGRFFVEGVVPEGRALPATVRLERIAGNTEDFRLDVSGPFRLEMKVQGGPTSPSADGYAVFVVDPAPGAGRASSALRVERLGIEAPAPLREGR